MVGVRAAGPGKPRVLGLPKADYGGSNRRLEVLVLEPWGMEEGAQQGTHVRAAPVHAQANTHFPFAVKRV